VKRSEVIKRAGGYWATTGCKEAPLGTISRLADNALVGIATALGIEVEPDEEPLPERLVLSAEDDYGPSSPERSMRNLNGNEGHILVYSSAGNARALLDALISAYNERPKWLTGVPPGPGRYLVSGPSYVEELYFNVAGEWLRDGEPMSWAHMSPWMPLPAAPKESE
jgi:hypothetical protein